MTAQQEKPRQTKILQPWERELIAEAEDKRFRRQERNIRSYYHHGQNNKRILFKGKDFAE